MPWLEHATPSAYSNPLLRLHCESACAASEPADFELGSFYLVWLDADGAPVDWALPSYEVVEVDGGG